LFIDSATEKLSKAVSASHAANSKKRKMHSVDAKPYVDEALKKQKKKKKKKVNLLLLNFLFFMQVVQDNSVVHLCSVSLMQLCLHFFIQLEHFYHTSVLLVCATMGPCTWNSLSSLIQCSPLFTIFKCSLN